MMCYLRWLRIRKQGGGQMTMALLVEHTITLFLSESKKVPVVSMQIQCTINPPTLRLKHWDLYVILQEEQLKTYQEGTICYLRWLRIRKQGGGQMTMALLAEHTITLFLSESNKVPVVRMQIQCIINPPTLTFVFVARLHHCKNAKSD